MSFPYATTKELEEVQVRCNALSKKVERLEGFMNDMMSPVDVETVETVEPVKRGPGRPRKPEAV